MIQFFARRRLAKQLGRYLSPKVVQEVLDGGVSDTRRISSRRIDFVFALVRAENCEQLATRTGLVVDLAWEHQAMVHHLIGPMVVMAFGTFGEASLPGSRLKLVNCLRNRFCGDIKIVHGAADGHFGSFGSDKYIAYTFTFPRFDHVLAILGTLAFGEMEEFLP